MSKQSKPSEFQIERGIPLPPPTRGGSRESKYPFAKMKKDESFFVPSHTAKPNSVGTSVRGFVKRHPGWAFALRKERDGVRVFCMGTPDQPANHPAIP